MARQGKGIIGGFKGGVGDIVGRRVNGSDIIQSAPPKYADSSKSYNVFRPIEPIAVHDTVAGDYFLRRVLESSTFQGSGYLPVLFPFSLFSIQVRITQSANVSRFVFNSLNSIGLVSDQPIAVLFTGYTVMLVIDRLLVDRVNELTENYTYQIDYYPSLISVYRIDSNNLTTLVFSHTIVPIYAIIPKIFIRNVDGGLYDIKIKGYSVPIRI
jgi:hypothetical protein